MRGGDGGGRWCSWSHESFKIVPSLPRKCQADLGRLTSIRLEEATRRQNTVKLSVRWRRFCSAILRKLSQGRSFVGYLAVDGCHQEIAIPSRHSHYHAIQHDTQSSLAVLNHSLGWLPPKKGRCWMDISGFSRARKQNGESHDWTAGAGKFRSPPHHSALTQQSSPIYSHTLA